jgi:predicted dehydrogenase
MSKQSTRRDFLKRGLAVAGAAAAAPLVAAPSILEDAAPSKKLGVAVIGAGGMGGYSMDLARAERLVAMVDVDEGTIETILKDLDKRGIAAPKVFYDYRKMLDECHKDLDAVLIATPDHNHAPAAIRSIHLGKATFSQKPLAHNIAECRALARAAKEKNVLTQMGNQGHCGESIRQVCEQIWAGSIGHVTETHTILGRNFGGTGGRPPSKPIPKGLHWDEWIGPAPYRDFHDDLHPFNWRSWRDFGTGTIGDMACHNLDTLYWALKIAEARTFTVECLSQKGGSEEKYATDNILRWEIPARGSLPPVKVHAYDHGDLKPEVMKETEKQYKIQYGECTLFVGDKGFLRIQGTSSGWQFLPEARKNEVPEPPKSLPRAQGGPIEDLFHCLKHGGTPCSNFPEAGGNLAAFVLTGHLAMFAGAGKKLQWDVETMQCTNFPEINRYVKREYRKGWEV